MSSVIIAGDTSGTVTLAAPAVSGTTTLTLPATTGTFITTGSTGQVINKASLPTGSVLQVVNANYTTYVSTSSTSIAATGLTATITPSSASSKILIFSTILGISVTTSNNALHLEIYKNGSFLNYWDDITGYGVVNVNSSSSISYLDSPATTSATTYSIWCKRVGAGAGTVQFNNYVTANQTVSSITLMEIAA